VQAPLFLSFDNNDTAGSPFKVIFKAGDDLRQDILILQMFGSSLSLRSATMAT
jgi:phosphatidylinositol kinase/protein kinase (PI-3  family)